MQAMHFVYCGGEIKMGSVYMIVLAIENCVLMPFFCLTLWYCAQYTEILLCCFDNCIVALLGRIL